MRRTLALLVVLLVASSSSAQNDKPRTVPFEGAEVFCHILFHEGLQPISSMETLKKDHEETLLILFGTPPRQMDRLVNATSGLGLFCKNGGNLLIVTDRPFGEGTLPLGVHGVRIQQPAEQAYRRETECPWLPSASGEDHPLFRSLRKGIATNRPSFVTFGKQGPPGGVLPGGGLQPGAMRRFPKGLEPLLRFSIDAERDGGSRPLFPPIYMMGSRKDAPPRGRILVIAGHGMFMNGMMLQTDKDNIEFDNDNFEFGVNAIRWLREGPDGKQRTKALLLVDGKIVTNFNMNLSPPATMPKPQIPVPPVEALNRLIRGMEEEGLFHKILRGSLGDNFERTIGLLLAFTTFAVLLYAAKKFLEGRYSRETSVPIMVGVLAVPAPSLTRGQQRNLALNRQANASQPASQLAAAWLRAEFGIVSDKLPAGALVAPQASGFFLSRWRLERRASWVVELARAPESARVTRQQFAQLIEALPGLSEAVASGRLELLVDGKTVRHGGG